MPTYDDYQVERIRQTLQELGATFTDKNMMGGRLFMVDDKMLCVLLFNKEQNQHLLMCRIGEEAYNRVIDEEHTQRQMSRRPMKGFIFVKEAGFDMDEDLARWLQMALDFNPFAKKSKKKKR